MRLANPPALETALAAIGSELPADLQLMHGF